MADAKTTSTTTEPEKLNLSASQVIASGLAAVSSTVAASYFGVAGTVIGAAFGAIISVVGNAVYGYSLRRTRNRVRQSLDVAVAHRFATDKDKVFADTASAQSDRAAEPSSDSARTRRFSWRPKRLALAAAGVFLAVLAATTAFEVVSGQPLSATVTGKHGSGTSIGGGTTKKASPTPSDVPSATTTPSSSSPVPSDSAASATPSDTPTESASPSDTGSPTGTGSPSGAPSDNGTGTGTATPAPAG
jgi:hypothetical protein